MNFRIPMPADKIGEPLRPFAPVLSAGSCFADNITARMRRAFWQAGNPFGVLFNPLSIASALRLTLLDSDAEADRKFAASTFINHDVHLSWLFDSRIAAPSRELLTANFRSMRDSAIATLRHGATLMVTFGTAGCYALSPTGQTVANCHKMPSAMFTRFRLDVDTVASLWSVLIADLAAAYPGLRVILTVSPVRYVKDGFTESARSKAVLLLAAERICSGRPECVYFPAYELLTDDLRDYRFYTADMAHPSEQAIEYIWEFFKQTMLSDRGRSQIEEGESLAARAAHRPLMPWTGEACRFRRQTAALLADFRLRHPDAVIPEIIP